MALFSSAAECLHYLEVCKNAFPVLKEIVKPGDLKAWGKKLESSASLDDFLLGEDGNLNLLNVSIMTGWVLETGQDQEPWLHYKRLLQKLSAFLDQFPTRTANRSFRGKVTDLAGMSFLATLSELTLAYQLATGGYAVAFETKFTHPDTATEKDVDISATDGHGNVLHFEVYMPHKSLEADGFLDLNQDEQNFQGKVEAKLLAKFGTEEIGDLSGRVFLAVNTAFFDLLRVKNAFAITASDYAKLARFLPRHVDGIFLFDDGFGSDTSFSFGKLVLKG